jgi:hypothetical protein
MFILSLNKFSDLVQQLDIRDEWSRLRDMEKNRSGDGGMARKKESTDQDNQTLRHPLLVYYNLGRRYRPVGIFLVFMGAFLFLPSLTSDFKNDAVKPETLAVAGIALILAGLAFWLFSRLAMRRSYVECRPDLLVIRTPFYRVLLSYRRIKLAQSVQVSQVFPKSSLKGMSKPLMRPLLAMTAAEVHVKSWPAPKRRLQRFLDRHLFSPKSEAWIFVVPNYSLLVRQLDAAMQRKAESDKNVADGYEDPFERLKYYGTNG